MALEVETGQHLGLGTLDVDLEKIDRVQAGLGDQGRQGAAPARARS